MRHWDLAHTVRSASAGLELSTRDSGQGHDPLNSGCFQRPVIHPQVGDGSGLVNITDAVNLLSFLFQGGGPPALGLECVRIEGCPDACAVEE